MNHEPGNPAGGNADKPQMDGRRWRKMRLNSRLFRHPFGLIPFLNVFLLIFFFVVFNSAFVLKPGIKVQLPVGGFQQGALYSSRAVILTQEGLVFYNDERVPLDALGNALCVSTGKDDAMPLTIEADLRVPYDTIIRTLNMAAAAGISNIFLSVRPTFGEEFMP
ncbi:MAG: biopolymer transporter ExbD [Kiritimatiellae bacterium]|nr:biopolymer transporter ExbD [Kiritimatiellia bacterium]